MFIYYRQLQSLLLVVLVSVCLPIWADLELDTLYLTWQRDPVHTMTIQWLSSPQQENTKLEYRVTGQTSWQPAVGTHFLLPGSKQYMVHRVELTNLYANTLYQFKLANQDAVNSFLTMPETLETPIRFVVGGDMYHDNDETKSMQKTCKQAVKQDPLFALIGGDIAYASAHKYSPERMERWIEWVHAWSSSMVTNEGRMIPVVAAIGNHDLVGHYNQTPAQAQVFSTLFPKSNNQTYHALDFGRYLSLIILDSGHANSVDGVQANWLKTTLQARRDISHRLAIYHVPAYPSVRPYHNTHSAAVRRHWVPLFENEGIQMVFEHHDHAYKRTFPLLKNKPNPKGIVYIGDGAWSVDKPRTSNIKTRKYLAKFVSSRHFILVTLDKEKQSIVSIDSTGQKLDEYQREISLQKNSVSKME